MKKPIIFFIVILLIAGFKWMNSQDFIVFSLDSPKGFPNVNTPDSNHYSEARYKLGRKLFFDPILSIDSSISCASCHKPQYAFADNRALSPGVFGRAGVRNVPSLINIAFHPYFLGEGGVKTLEMQVLVPIQEKNEFAHNIVDISEQLQYDPTYVQMSREAYGRNPDPYVISRSISVFQRTLLSADSRYDDFKFGKNENALNDSEKRGKSLFFSRKTNCFFCHSGVNFTNYLFENNGLYEDYIDPGRYRISKDSADIGKFKVPSLRNIQITKPYMHDGSLANLEEVLDHYNSGGKSHPNKNGFIKPLGLTPQEKKDLINFLKSLTDSIYL